MADYPYLPMFIDDYEGATAHLSLAEDGAYTRLLRLCWRTPGCSLPNDPEWIARRMRVDSDTYAAVVQPIITEFFALDNGRIVQRRLLKEFERATNISKARKAAGKKGGKAKAQNNKGNGASKAKDLLEQKPSKKLASIPIPTPTPIDDSLGAAKRGTRLPNDFVMPVEWIDAAVSEVGISRDVAQTEAKKFTYHWQAESGRTACKVNWRRAFLKWAVIAKERGGRRTTTSDGREYLGV